MFIISLGNDNYYYGDINGKSFNLKTILKKIKKLNPSLDISNVANPIFTRFLINVRDGKEIFENTIESSDLIEMFDEYNGFFTCESVSDLFTLQGNIYQELIDSNIYN